jgi:hypothetical protein
MEMHKNMPQHARIGLWRRSHPFDCPCDTMDLAGGLNCGTCETHGNGGEEPIGEGCIIDVEEQQIW